MRRRGALRECPGSSSIALARRRRTAAVVADAYGDRFAAARRGRAAFVEACLVLEEGVAGVRDIDMG